MKFTLGTVFTSIPLPMKWITRERPKIDRIACPWLISRFVDPEAQFYFVPFEQVLIRARELEAIPFDIPDVEYTHYGDECTFDYIVKKHNIKDPGVLALAVIVRGADTDRHDLAGPCAGLWAISAGLSHVERDDHALVEKGKLIYDALYAWARYLQHEKHGQNPVENRLLDIYRKFLQEKKEKKKIPAWARELKNLIQDQIDTNLSLSLKEVSESLNVHPSYLSREFSKYFDDLSFGDYIRKLRIEKALVLMNDPRHSLAEIAYLTGFSDQSHFNRIFKSQLGKSPAVYRKEIVEKK